MSRYGIVEFIWVFGIGFLWGFAIFVPGRIDQDMIDKAKQVIAECQRQLPRDQICELSAKVKETKD